MFGKTIASTCVASVLAGGVCFLHTPPLHLEIQPDQLFKQIGSNRTVPTLSVELTGFFRMPHRPANLYQMLLVLIPIHEVTLQIAVEKGEVGTLKLRLYSKATPTSAEEMISFFTPDGASRHWITPHV